MVIRDLHAKYQFTGGQSIIKFGMIFGQAVELGHWYAPFAFFAGYYYYGIQSGQADAHIAGVHRYAMVACAENGVHPVITLHRAAARAGLALVAGHGGIVKI